MARETNCTLTSYMLGTSYVMGTSGTVTSYMVGTSDGGRPGWSMEALMAHSGKILEIDMIQYI